MKRQPLDMTAAMNAYQFPYIAVMTIFCIFFMMMYAYYYKMYDEKATENEKVAQVIKENVQDNPALSSSSSVEVTPDGIRLTLPSSLIFSAGSDALQPATVPALQKVAATINALPPGVKVIVEGHTDNAPVWYGGDFSSNWELSLYRALSIIDFFITQGGNPDRYIAAGYGEFRPRAANDTPEHRAANRRVEITIRKQEIKVQEWKNS
jgi:chemotaxis protein MotB